MITKKAFSFRILISIFQLFIGLLLCYSIFLKISADGFLSSVLIGVPLLLLAIFSFYSGISLLTNTRKGFKLSLVNLSLHLFQFSFSGIYYYMIIGPFVFLGYQKVAEKGLSFWTDYGLFTHTIFFSLTPENNNTHFFTLNLVTLILIVVLLFLKNRTTKEKKIENTVPNNI